MERVADTEASSTVSGNSGTERCEAAMPKDIRNTGESVTLTHGGIPEVGGKPHLLH